MADNVPCLRQLIESDLRVDDPKGDFGPKREKVPALVMDGVLWILGRNGEIVTPVGPVGIEMMKQAREQIEGILVGGMMGMWG